MMSKPMNYDFEAIQKKIENGYSQRSDELL